MRKGVQVVAAALLIAVAGATVVLGQHTETRTMVMDASTTIFVNELGAMIQASGDTLTIEMIMPADQRHADYKDVDLKKGDRILMCNGKKLEDIASLRELIDSLEYGETIKFGVIRDGQMMMASFPKADPSKLGGRMMMMQVEDDGTGEVKKTMTLGGPGGVEGTVVVLDGGLILAPGEESLKVVALMPFAADKISGEMPAEGDLIVSVNDVKETDAAGFQAEYDKIADGETVTVVFSRDGKQHTATYEKSPMQSRQMMIEK
jgi:S1-C subfamily serine protease